MYALERPLPRLDGLLAGTPVALLVTLTAALAAAAALSAAAAIPPAVAGVVAIAAGQGGLLATAIAWATTGDRRPPAPAVPVALLAVAAALGAARPLGALAYLAVPLWLAWHARAGRLRRLGLDARLPGPALAAGALMGAVLGAHLLISASLTLGYRVRVPPAPSLLAWLGYDLGANVVAAECFFRGALFARAHRRWPFGAAAALATTACVARYLVDPLLPPSVEMLLGAAFYIALLGVANCWLLARTGSLLPGLAATAVFFTAYRLLAPA